MDIPTIVLGFPAIRASNMAIFQHDDGMRERQKSLRLMGDNQDSPALGKLALQQRQKVTHAKRIETDCGLIEDKEVVLEGKDAGKPYATFLSTRQTQGVTPGKRPRVQPHFLKGRLCKSRRIPTRVPFVTRTEGNVVDDS